MLTMNYREIKEFARELRNYPTPEEKILWNFKVRRQEIFAAVPYYF